MVIAHMIRDRRARVRIRIEGLDLVPAGKAGTQYRTNGLKVVQL